MKINKINGCINFLQLHEEIFYLAQADDLKHVLFAPNLHTLLALHNKWSFYQLAGAAGLSVPPSILCRSMADVLKLDINKVISAVVVIIYLL